MWNCINVQKISYFHLFVFELQSIFESRDQTGYTHFWLRSPQKFSITFYFTWICTRMQISVNSTCSFLRYSQFWSPVTKLATLIFDHAKAKNFRRTFNFCEFVSACKKWGCFIDLFLRNSWIKNLVIWLAENILVYISKTRFFPIIGFA